MKTKEKEKKKEIQLQGKSTKINRVSHKQPNFKLKD
jgi:muconolactone delta-isomerase